VALPFAATFWGQGSAAWWLQGLKSLSYLLAMPAVTAFLALNFTGSTPLTSRTGVRREIFAYIPVMAGMFAAGILLTIAFAVMRFVKG
jgi:hypothetical protein